MTCDEKERLFNEYNACVSDWAQAVERLKDAASSQSRYLELLSSVDDARGKTQRAKAEHMRHMAEHGCAGQI
jgi:hypothetical protein